MHEVEAAHQTTADEIGVHISVPDTPQKNSELEGIVFEGVDQSSGVQVKTHITREILDRIASLEQNAYGEGGRSFKGAIDQFEEELRESRENFAHVKRGKTNLSVNETLHNQREEIGDGLISSVGLVRKLMSDDEAIDFVAEVDYKRRLNPISTNTIKESEKGIRKYHKAGKKLLRRLKDIDVDDSSQMTEEEQKKIKKHLRRVLGSGLDAMDLLNANSSLIDRKLQITSRLKYSKARIERTGSASAAKKEWERRQLPVLNHEIVLLDNAA